MTGLQCAATTWSWSDKTIPMRPYATCLTYNLALFYNLPLHMRVCLQFLFRSATACSPRMLDSQYSSARPFFVLWRSTPALNLVTLYLEDKPLPALLTAMILAGLRDPLLFPAACELESLGPVLPSSTTTTERKHFSGTETVVPGSSVSQEQVLAFSYKAAGVSPTARLLRRARLQQQEAAPRLSATPLHTSSPIIPPVPKDCPALGTLPDPPELPEPQHQLVLCEHVAYEGCLEAWRGTLDQSMQVLAKLFLHEHIESAHREACAYERFLSVPRIEGTTVPRYWGTYTYRGEFYVIVLEDTGPKLKNFRDCSPRQRRAIARHARKVHGSGLGFPAAASHFTCDADGEIRVVDFGDSFEHRCDPETCEELKKLVRLLDEMAADNPITLLPFKSFKKGYDEALGRVIPVQYAACSSRKIWVGFKWDFR
ncbi:hypothetical protein H4582DRAFT_1499944 [Lactarius indigo]|nr:hypothetical protein H4582DRAFT_1499944 [Lactarius indigo]